MKPSKQMLAVFMPARNEQKRIGKNVDVLKEGIQNGKISHAVIVIDGSTDRTAEKVFTKIGLTETQINKLTLKKRGTLVLPNGFIIIHHKQPEGKGRNFVETVFTLKGRTNFFKNPNSVLVNIDADAVNLKGKIITGISGEISKKGVPMILGKSLEKGQDNKSSYRSHALAIGFRALKAKALEPMLKRDPVWVRTFPRGFGMDYALNMLIYERDYLTQRDIGRLDHNTIPTSRFKLLHEKRGKHSSDYKQYLQRYDARLRFLRQPNIQKHLSFIGPEHLAFREKAKRKKLK